MVRETDVNYANTSILGDPSWVVIIDRILLPYRKSTFPNNCHCKCCHHAYLLLPSSVSYNNGISVLPIHYRVVQACFHYLGQAVEFPKTTQHSFLHSPQDIANYIYFLSSIPIFRDTIN